ncbi:MAG: nucleoside triphosphate pyrophosphohydrolase [Firmicutes bacterium]|nr:nucleoside triphosphate pyrophosphohydrolase [Bacillota bacterium]
MKKTEYVPLYEAKDNQGEALERLVEIIKVLRVKCPWDSVQTHDTLTKCMLEEAYEAVDAIQEQNVENLREELGDVLLQVVFHCNLSEEEGDFNLTDVINEECEKMIRRHPHIFLQEEVKTIDKALEKWENVKSKEHGEERYTDRLNRVPKALPALLRSSKVQGKASKVGFDWDDASGAFDKLEEEIKELRCAYEKGDAQNMTEEFGDLLFSMVNVSRFLEIDPEEALNQTTAKFIRRFDKMECIASEKGLNFAELSLEEMDKLWVEAKK